MNNKNLDDSTKPKYNKEGGPEEKKYKLPHNRNKRILTSFNTCDLLKQKLHLQENIKRQQGSTIPWLRQQQTTNKRFRQNC